MKATILLVMLIFFFANIAYTQVNEEWVRRYNGPGNAQDEARSIAVDNDGNVYVTGGSWGEETDYGYATIKYDSAGVEQSGKWCLFLQDSG